MKNAIINTDLHTYLVKFNFQITDGQFITQGAGLMDVLKEHDKNGVKYIKIFDPVKYAFKSISRAKILQLMSWETEALIYLQNHYFFK
jgi:hypothetical protein